ncbi:heterogeneous nuclear ribonucleoprotein U-like protein 2 [Teleopsis dalmanni]|uniref:heterogeneous nuclear ribonucleoprotein U-like protein 2 n=1 Tax=Teleopsis dalmanni TaxID=139649 RepID=UPI0018CFB3B9|nr:heterogeneous nuclear ribonucleoprotein U-like protein 2 [Teleopsis dalmanni]
MDIAKLEKMKVVDLRNELQTRGLDTKGVKAVLIERLRAHIDGGSGEGGVIPGTPGTPGRRSRRTRSMTRSPSPSPVKVTEQLEPLEEEESNSAAVNSDAEEEFESPIEDVVAEAPEDEPYTTEQVEEESNEVEETDDIEMNEEQIIENVNDDEDSEMHDNNTNDRVEETILSDNMEGTNEQEVGTEKPKEHEEENTAAEIEENVTSDEIKKDISSHEIKENIPSHEIKEKKSMERDPTQSRKRSRDHSRSHSRTRSRSPKRRSEESPNASPIKAEEITNLEDEPTTEDKQFGLSWYDSDLHLRIDPVTFTSAKPMTHEIYSLVWSGVRTNYGVREGKVCFEVRLAEEIVMNRSHQFRNEPHVRGFRVGFSMPHSSLILGEEENSFAYCETGRKAVNSDFTDYSKPYKLDDVIGCYLDLESTPCTIKYTLNGEDLGVAFEFDKTILGESNALFPHIVTKGYEFHVNFADNENLLANVVRPTRMRRKIRKSTLNDNAENSEVHDEEKMDEAEKLNGTNKDKQTEIESDEKTDVISTETTEVITNMEVEINKDNKNTEDFDGENNSNSVAVVSTPVNDGDNNKIEESENSEKIKSEEDKDDGPSPTKRAKVEDKDKEKDKSNQSEISEDEYEEVLPEPRDPVLLLPDYELIALIPEENYISGPQRPDSRKECEVILLVGLPGAGKTHWTLNHVKENPDKRYHVIGIDALIAKMTLQYKCTWNNLNNHVFIVN